MNNKKSLVQKSFRNSLIVSGLILFILTSILFTHGTSHSSSAFFIGLPMLISAIFSMVGLTQIIKGFKEKKTFKFFYSLIVNGLVFVLFLAAFIVNILDIFSALT